MRHRGDKMKEKLFRSSKAMGLAARIIVSVFIIVFIIWKYDELKNIDIRALVDSSSSVFAAVGLIWGVYLLKSVTLILPASLVYITERRHAIGIMRPHFCRKYGKIHTSIRST